MNTRPQPLIALALGLLLVTTAGAAPPAAVLPTVRPEAVGLSSERLARLDRYLDEQIARGRVAGGVVLIARRGKVAYFKAVGSADLASHRQMRTDDYFRLMSLTKPVTAAALLTLFEQGKFQLTDPLSKYLPAFKNVKVYTGKGPNGEMLLEDPKKPITIQDVLRHTAGFVYGWRPNSAVDAAYREAGIDYSKVDSVHAMTDLIATMPLASQPGTQFEYSFSHDVQAYLIEYFSGMPFQAYCRKVILEPLGMHQTVYGVPDALAARFPTVYNPSAEGGLAPYPGASGYARYTQHPFGGISLSSTPADYLRFAQMLLNGGELGGVRILGRKTVELMTTDQLAPAGIPLGYPGYGFGLGIGVLADPVRNGNVGSAGQFGWSGFWTTTAVIDPKEQLIAIYFEQVAPEDRDLLDYFTTLVYQAIVD